MLRLKVVLAVAMFTCASVVAMANMPSNTVPTSQLWTNYGIQASGGTQVSLSVTFVQVLVDQGKLSLNPLDQSPEDLVSFSDGQHTVTYDPAHSASNVLPFNAGGTYTVSFIRSSGESYSSTVVLPGLATISQPTAGQVFNKTDSVVVNWTPPSAGTPAMFGLGASCAGVAGNPAYNASYTSLTIPAGYVAACPGAVQMEFDAIYVNGGTGFGDLGGISTTSILFSYGASVPTHVMAVQDPKLMQKFMNAMHSGLKTLSYTF